MAKVASPWLMPNGREVLGLHAAYRGGYRHLFFRTEISKACMIRALLHVRVSLLAEYGA